MHGQDVPATADLDTASCELVGGFPTPPDPARADRLIDLADDRDRIFAGECPRSSAGGEAEADFFTYRNCNRCALRDARLRQPFLGFDLHLKAASCDHLTSLALWTISSAIVHHSPRRLIYVHATAHIVWAGRQET